MGVPIMSIITSAIAQIATGKPIWRISMPACVHTDLSGLEALRKIIFHSQTTLEKYEKINETEDAIERLGLCLSAIVDQHTSFFTDKPFNPILGEYIVCTSTVESEKDKKDFKFAVEQVSHHPPIATVEIKGPNFKLYAPNGVTIDGLKAINPGLNHLDIKFTGCLIRLETKNGYMLEWDNIGYRLGNLFFNTRTVSYFGPLDIKDKSSGLRFCGKVKQDLEIEGDIIDERNVAVHNITGNMHKALYLDGELWIDLSTETYVPLKLDFKEEDLNNPLFSNNVWKNVLKFMRMSPPDFHNADIEKTVVEEKQRELVRSGAKFKSTLNLI